MNQDQNNALLNAISAVAINFTQQVVEQATKPLVERITVLEAQLSERLSVERNNDWVAVLQCNLLDEVDKRIKTALKNLSADDITGLSAAIEESLQNQPPLAADDISGLDKFVRSEIADHLDGDELESELTNKIKDAFQAAVDSL